MTKNELGEVALEYESDSIEYYKMLSNEFNYEKIKQDPLFNIKQYKNGAIYRG